MLKIILKVKNIFSDEREQAVTIGDDDGKRVTLAYGLNGTGKTTLSTFLYKKFVVSEDVSQGAYADCEAEGFDDKRVLVFNREFIKDNFVDVDKQRGIFSLSKASKDAREDILRLKSKQKEQGENLTNKGKYLVQKQSDLNKLGKEIKEYTWKKFTSIRENKKFHAFLTGTRHDGKAFLDRLANMPSPLASGESEESLEKELDALSTGNELGKMPPFSFDVIKGIEKNPIWSKAIEVKKYSSYADINWVKQGVYKYLTEGEDGQPCPFCQQKMTHQIVKGLKDLFDEQYKSKEMLLNKLIADYKREKETLSARRARGETHLQNASVSKEAKDFNESTDALLRAMEENLKIMEDKLSAPSMEVSIDSKVAQEEYQEMAAALDSAIDKFNEKIRNAGKARDQIKEKLWSLMKWEFEEDPLVKKYRVDIPAARQERDTAKKEKAELENAVKETTARIAALEKEHHGTAASVDAINTGLRRLGIPNFKMERVENDYAIRRFPGEKSGAIYTELSEGEKTIICFLYFMELCKGKGSAEEVPANEQVVIIDDPISSLSHQFALNVSQMIVGYVRAGKAENSGVKALILTHNLYFFHELKRSFAPRKDKVKERIVMYRFFRKGKDDNNRLIHIDSMEDGEIVSEYQSYWATIQDEDHPACVANAMRCILEYFFGFMLNLNSLDEVLNRIRKNDDDYTNAFIRYMQKGSHLNAEILDIEAEMDVEQWMKQFKRVFEENNHLDHFDAMMRNRKSKSASGE